MKPRGKLATVSFRALGVILGSMIVLIAPLILVENARYTPWDILSCLGMLAVGLPFLIFGITGNEKPRLIPRSAVWWVALLLGGLFLAAGAYALLVEDSSDAFRTVLAVAWIPVGVGLLWLGILARRRQVKHPST